MDIVANIHINIMGTQSHTHTRTHARMHEWMHAHIIEGHHNICIAHVVLSCSRYNISVLSRLNARYFFFNFCICSETLNGTTIAWLIMIYRHIEPINHVKLRIWDISRCDNGNVTAFMSLCEFNHLEGRTYYPYMFDTCRLHSRIVTIKIQVHCVKCNNW